MNVSHRWIDYCLEKKTIFTQFRSKVFLNLIPFPFPTPIKSFNRISFCVSGFDND